MAEKKIKTKKVKQEKADQPSKIALAAKARSRGAVIGAAVFVSIVISLLAYFFFVGPQFGRVGPGSEFDVEATDSLLTQRKQTLNQLKALSSNVAQIEQADIDKVAKVLPADISLPELLVQLDAMARQSGVDLLGVETREILPEETGVRQRLQQTEQASAQTRKGVQEVEVSLEVSSFSYVRFKTFVETLANHRRILDVQTMQYVQGEESHEITVKTYYLIS